MFLIFEAKFVIGFQKIELWLSVTTGRTDPRGSTLYILQFTANSTAVPVAKTLGLRTRPQGDGECRIHPSIQKPDPDYGPKSSNTLQAGESINEAIRYVAENVKP